VDPSIQTSSVDLWLTMIEGDYDHGVAELKQALEWRRAAGISQELPLQQLGYLAFESGDPVAGLRWSAMLETLPAARGHAEMIHLLALARMGDERGMKNLVQKNFGLYSINWAACDVIGRAYALLGDKDEALRWLERSVARGAYDSGTWERSDTLDGLRGNERFESVLAIVKERSREIVEIAEFAGYR
jgi:tetratricopeptide (TPR) repeat protein